MDNNYRCIARGILKNKSQIKIPDKAEKQNQTKNRTRQAERRPRSKTDTDWQKRKTQNNDSKERLLPSPESKSISDSS